MTSVVSVDIEKMLEGSPLGDAYQLAHSPTMQSMSDQDLQNAIRPTVKQAIVKQKFWREYNRVCEERNSFQIANVYVPEMTRSYFYGLLKNQRFAAWLFRPPHSFEDAMEALSGMAFNKVAEIFNCQLYDLDGKLNVPAASLVVKTWEAIENRHRGMAVQRIEEKTIKLQATVKEGETLGDLKKRLEELKTGTTAPKEITDDSTD